MKPMITLLACCAALAVGCGGDDDNAAQLTATTPSAAEIAREKNAAAIAGAEAAPDAQAETGERAILRTLKRELGMNDLQEFAFAGNVDEVLDCYVKTGAEAVNFSGQAQNMLYSPADPNDLVFVQSSQGTPLAKCLRYVKRALDW